MRTTVMDYLSLNGFNVLSAEDGEVALEVFKANKSCVDIILLDGMLPKLDGLEVLKTIRRMSMVPVIMISARESEMDQLRGFYNGADNYITKPFLLSILKEQINALLNRTSPKVEDHIIRGAIRIDTNLHRLYIDEVEVYTTPKEYDLLMYFIENEKIVLDRNQILDRVWGMDYYGDFRTVDTIIKQLRRKLTDRHKYIKSVYGVGYYFEVDNV
ncbi:MAG: response regulator transcription factor [Ruminococcus sp.]|nr:response regulator transcription factor [Ruminococcus sp.]